MIEIFCLFVCLNLIWFPFFGVKNHNRLCGRFIEQMLMLSSSFKCDQIKKYEWYDFGHTLLSYLSQTWMFNMVGSFNIQVRLK